MHARRVRSPDACATIVANRRATAVRFTKIPEIFRADLNPRASRLQIDRWIQASTTFIERPFTVIARLLK